MEFQKGSDLGSGRVKLLFYFSPELHFILILIFYSSGLRVEWSGLQAEDNQPRNESENVE
jgi:hypothetical protein